MLTGTDEQRITSHIQAMIRDAFAQYDEHVTKAIVTAVKEDRLRPEARDSISFSPATVASLDTNGNITVAFDTDPSAGSVPVGIFGGATVGQRGQVIHAPGGGSYFIGMTGVGGGGGPPTPPPPPTHGPLFGSQDNVVDLPTSLTTYGAPTVWSLRRDDGSFAPDAVISLPVGGGETVGTLTFDAQTGTEFVPVGSVSGFTDTASGAVAGLLDIDDPINLDSDTFTVDGTTAGTTVATGGGIMFSVQYPGSTTTTEAARFNANGELWQTVEGTNRSNSGLVSYWFDGVHNYPSVMGGPSGIQTIVGTNSFDSAHLPLVPFQSFATFRNIPGTTVTTAGTFQMGFSPNIVADGGQLLAAGPSFDSGLVIPPGSPTQQEDATPRFPAWHCVIDDSYFSAINGGIQNFTNRDGKSTGFFTLPVYAGAVNHATRIDFWASEVALHPQQTGNDPTLYRTAVIATTLGNVDIIGNAPHPQFLTSDVGSTVEGNGIPPNTVITVVNPFFDAATLSKPAMGTFPNVIVIIKQMPNIGRHIALKVDALRAATHNRAMQLGAPIEGYPDDYTHWRLPFDTAGAFVTIGSRMLLDFHNATIGNFVSWNPTVEIKQDGNPLATAAGYSDGATYKNARRTLVNCSVNTGSAVLSSRNGAGAVSGPGSADFGPGDIGATINIQHLFDVLTTTIIAVLDVTAVVLATTWPGTSTTSAVSTVTNDATLGAIYSAFYTPTVIADGINMTIQAQQASIISSPNYLAANGGTLTLGTVQGMEFVPTVGSGVTVDRINAFQVNDAISSGTINSQYGIFVQPLVAAGESNPNIGVHTGAPLWINVAHTETQDPVEGTQIGTPLLIDYNQTINYSASHGAGDPLNLIKNIAFTSWANPYLTNPGGLPGPAVYGTIPDGPRALITLEGTTQWDVGAGLAGGPGLFYTWYIFKNKPGVAANIGPNVMISNQYQFLADNASIAISVIPDVMAPNLLGGTTGPDFSAASAFSWGTCDNPWYGTKGANGHLTADKSIGFISIPMFMGNVQFGTRIDYMSYEAHMNFGLAPQTAIFPTLGTHIGLYMQPFRAASKNISIVVNNGIQAFDQDRTYTTNPFKGLGLPAEGFIGLNSWLSFQNRMTLDYANAALGSVFSFTPTIELAQNPFSAGIVNIFRHGATYQNKSGSPTNALAGATTVLSDLTYLAIGTAISAGDAHGFFDTPSYSVSAGGSFTGFTTYTAFESSLIVNTGAHVEVRYGWKFNDITGGTLFNPRVAQQYGVNIARLVNAGENYGISNSSTTLWPGHVEVVANNTSQILITSTNVYLSNTTGSGIILGSTPTLLGGRDGETATLLNIDAGTITLLDRLTNPGSGLALLSPSVTLSQYQAIIVSYHAASGLWVQTSGVGGTIAGAPVYAFRVDGTINDITAGGGIYGTRGVGIAANMSLRRVNNPGAATALAVGDLIHKISYHGFNSASGTYTGGAGISGVAEENYTVAGHFGGRLEFLTTPIASSTQTIRTVIDSAGTLWHGGIIQAGGVTTGGNFQVTSGGSVFAGGSITSQIAAGFPVLTLRGTGAVGANPIEYVIQGRATTTTNATATVATIGVNSASTYMIEANVVARRTDATNTGDALGAIRVATIKGSTTTPVLVGNVATVGQPHTAFAAGFVAHQQQSNTWAANTSYVTIVIVGTNAIVQVTGVAGASISWHCTCRVWSVAT